MAILTAGVSSSLRGRFEFLYNDHSKDFILKRFLLQNLEIGLFQFYDEVLVEFIANYVSIIGFERVC